MAKNKRSKKKTIIIIVASLLILIAAALVFLFSGVNTFLKPVIKDALTKLVVNGSDSLYRFSIKDYAVGPGGRNVVITDLHIEVDSTHYYRLKAAGKLPALVIALDVDKVSVTGLHSIELYKHQQIICRSVGVENAKVTFWQQEKRTDTTKTSPVKNLYELISPDIKLIQVENLFVKNSNIDFKTVGQRSTPNESWHFEDANLTMSNILVDSTSYADTARAWYADNIHTSLGKFKMEEKGAMYHFSVANTEYDFKKRTATIDSLKILPAISNAEFSRRMGHEADQVTITVPAIKLEQFNAAALLSENIIETGILDIDNPVIKLYKDRTAGTDTRNKTGKFPHQLLLKADPDINVALVKISGGSLTVTQKSPKTKMEGSFTFRNVQGNIKNVTNMRSMIANNAWCKASLSANFMGGNPMNAFFSFDLASDNGHFVTDATLQTMQASNLNKMLRALAGADLESFTLDKLFYHVEGYEQYAVGDLQLLYHDLKMNALEKDENGKFEEKKLMSFLANFLKLYKENPQNNQEEREANNIKDTRPYNKNFFGLICQTLLKCTQEIVIKGDNKTLPGLGNGNAGSKKKKKGILSIFQKKN